MTQLLPTAHLACWLFPALNLTCVVPRGRNTLHGVPDLATTAILVLLQGLIRQTLLPFGMVPDHLPHQDPSSQVSASFPSPQNLHFHLFIHVSFFQVPGPMQHNLS